MKRLLSIFVTIVLAIMCCMTAYAEMTTFAISSEKRASTLVISGTTATCTSQYVAANNNVSKVFITQTLEKHSFLWAWETVGGTRTKTVNGSSASLTGKVSGLASGTYRVKTVFDVTANGTTETITVYSAEKTV